MGCTNIPNYSKNWTLWRSVFLGGTYNNTVTEVFTDDKSVITVVYTSMGTLLQITVEKADI